MIPRITYIQEGFVLMTSLLPNKTLMKKLWNLSVRLDIETKMLKTSEETNEISVILQRSFNISL